MQSMGFSLLGQQSKAEEGRWSIKWREQVAAAMISVFVSPLNSYIGHLRFKVLAGGAFGRSLGHGDRALRSGIQFSSVQFNRSVVSDSLRPHKSQHSRPPCPSPSPGVTSDSRPRVRDAIQPSHPRLSPSPPAPNPSQNQSFFQ